MGRNVRRVLIMLLGLVVFFLLSFTPLGHSVQGIIQPVFKPIAQTTRAIGSWLDQFWRISSLTRANESLQHQVAELSARQSTAEALYQENDELRQMLLLPTMTGYDRLAVEIIGQQIDETGTSYLVNRGSNDGLTTGLAAVAGTPGVGQDTSGLILVGTINNVGSTVSNLHLITSGSSKVLAKLAQGLAGQSLAVGEYNLAVRLKFLEIDEQVTIGEAVVTSNLNRLIPAGLLLGTVTAVDKQEGALFQSAVVAPPVPLEQFRFLYILRPVSP
ncbi:MAG: Cell shape-determining protein MreC [Parcubacteria group bacterium GW2011_GWD2_43_10]|uniref:Cell shape-determining protein MreC n=2 Tax=Candidatus Vebleniibacteriota TaxID=1817921 RepID=A0A1G2Q638_9BACT|nr:MAG: Cell shape-determining protein MreC [Parcubacteria group bacterium GW2011_GWD1_42_9]KKS81765.1 MAG: Cell shape-determining protein MreC [Parcubacteria group bacterium GW2011_GWD2_43_10]KKT14183.1 MAG: Cell shape-determining protein MreC [Parcubacteria group bacterium GW2011_GWA1_43_27]KKT26609.1 MAG: Cell shape-determining protein MreC [Parcubacteria group bacterium GW2011_GWF1_43_9]OHA55322.1 MAG: hypothetical protein A2429_00995 [Candidatus Veblenbacteria bacterium RIFOXYC1_FULL_42_9]